MWLFPLYNLSFTNSGLLLQVFLKNRKNVIDYTCIFSSQRWLKRVRLYSCEFVRRAAQIGAFKSGYFLCGHSHHIFSFWPPWRRFRCGLHVYFHDGGRTSCLADGLATSSWTTVTSAQTKVGDLLNSCVHR